MRIVKASLLPERKLVENPSGLSPEPRMNPGQMLRMHIRFANLYLQQKMSSFCHEADLPPRGHWKARGVALNEVDIYLGILGEAGAQSYLGIRQKPNDTAFLDYMINVKNSEDRYLDSSSRIGWKEKWFSVLELRVSYSRAASYV
ncbi:hypothetical protein WAI453_000682 [Rhynchosporium graminicola]